MRYLKFSRNGQHYVSLFADAVNGSVEAAVNAANTYVGGPGAQMHLAPWTASHLRTMAEDGKVGERVEYRDTVDGAVWTLEVF